MNWSIQLFLQMDWSFHLFIQMDWSFKICIFPKGLKFTTTIPNRLMFSTLSANGLKFSTYNLCYFTVDGQIHVYPIVNSFLPSLPFYIFHLFLHFLEIFNGGKVFYCVLAKFHLSLSHFSISEQSCVGVKKGEFISLIMLSLASYLSKFTICNRLLLK